jgi:hydrogenase maturation protein HypF
VSNDASAVQQRLPRAAPARVLAVGAWLKNTACLLDGDTVHWSALHGDLGTPEACGALDGSLQRLLALADARGVDAVAHDLHPDFESTRLALALADSLGVPAIAVQHHHAHIGVVQAEQGSTATVIGIALDGVGLGSDGTAWGGELLQVAGAQWRRLDHLTPLSLPGGDIAAREPWRMAAAALHVLGRGDEIVTRFAPDVGERLARGVHTLLERGLNCPSSTSAGRWFDAMAGLLGLSLRQTQEAQAAIALEAAAAQWLQDNDAGSLPTLPMKGLDLRPLVCACLAVGDPGRAAALFHIGLAAALTRAASTAARAAATRTVVLGGGCFFNRVLSTRLVAGLEAAGLVVQRVQGPGPGDAGLALGQAWIAAATLAEGRAVIAEAEVSTCA